MQCLKVHLQLNPYSGSFQEYLDVGGSDLTESEYNQTMNTINNAMPQGSPGQLNPYESANPTGLSVADFNQKYDPTGYTDSPDMDEGIGLTRQELYEQQDTSLTQTLKDKFGSLLPDNFDAATVAGKTFVNAIVGKPITIAFDIAKAVFGMLPDGIAATTNKARETGLLQGDSTVTQDIYGIGTQSALGDYDQYNIDRVDQFRNSFR